MVTGSIRINRPGPQWPLVTHTKPSPNVNWLSSHKAGRRADLVSFMVPGSIRVSRSPAVAHNAPFDHAIADGEPPRWTMRIFDGTAGTALDPSAPTPRRSSSAATNTNAPTPMETSDPRPKAMPPAYRPAGLRQPVADRPRPAGWSI